MVNFQIADVSDIKNAKSVEIIEEWTGLDCVVIHLDAPVTSAIVKKLKGVGKKLGIKIMTMTTQEFDLFEAEMNKIIDEFMEKHPDTPDITAVEFDQWAAMMIAVPDIKDNHHTFMEASEPEPEKPAIVQASAIITDAIKLVSNNPNVKPEPRRMYSQEEVDKKVEEALAPLYETLARFEKLFDKMNEEAERQGAAKHEPPVVEDVPEEPTAEEVVFGLRARYAALDTERKEAHAKWIKALRDRDKEATKIHRERYDQICDEQIKIEADPTFRTKCADILYGTADATRNYGHRTVDAVADAMHKAVDMTANGIDKVGKMVDKKDRLVTEAAEIIVPEAPKPIAD